MRLYDEVLQNALSQVVWPEDWTKAARDDAIATLSQKMAAEISAGVHDEVMGKAPEMLSEQRRLTAGFERRNRARWKDPVDLLRVMIRIAEESLVESIDEWNAAPRSQDHYSFNALNRLCVRSLVVAKEVICLVQGGFADGALGRWRSLHEAAVSAAFIAKHGESTAERFVASFTFASRKAMVQLKEYGDRANLKQFSASELQAAETRCLEIEAKLGKGLGMEYGWARHALGLGLRDKITLLHLEKDVGLDHWRPRYRWASQSVHTSYVPPMASLAMAESKEEVNLTGPSNSGMVDPLQMAAVSLLITVTTFLEKWPSLDSLIASNLLELVSDQVGPSAVEAERASAAQAVAMQKQSSS